MANRFDFHVHPSLKPLHSRSKEGEGKPDNEARDYIPDEDLWRFREADIPARGRLLGPGQLVDAIFGEIVKTSQSNFDQLDKGEVNCITTSLYPIERGFLKRGDGHSNDQSYWDRALAYYMGFDVSSINLMQRDDYDYFDMLQLEYDLLEKGSGSTQYSHGNVCYQLVKDYASLQQTVADGNIAVIVSIEGSHSFGIGTPDTMAAEEAGGHAWEQLREKVLGNVHKVKCWKYPPLVVGPAHHFYNQLCGLSPSIDGGSALNNLFAPAIANQKGTSAGVKYFELGLRILGQDLIKLLISDKAINANGEEVTVPRTMIDIKHMSPQARKDYYAILDALPDEEKVPVVATHTGVAGYDSIDDLIGLINGTKSKPDPNVPELTAAGIDRNYVAREPINASDDEIRRIHSSGGLFGLMMLETRLMPKSRLDYVNENTKKEIRKAQKDIEKLEERLTGSFWSARKKRKLEARLVETKEKKTALYQQQRDIYMDVMFTQLFYIVEVIGEESGWDCICIGSDFDGVLNPMDAYPDAIDMGQLERDMIQYWEDKINLLRDEPHHRYVRFAYGKEPTHFIRKIMWDNAMEFWRRFLGE